MKPTVVEALALIVVVVTNMIRTVVTFYKEHDDTDLFFTVVLNDHFEDEEEACEWALEKKGMTEEDIDDFVVQHLNPWSLY